MMDVSTPIIGFRARSQCHYPAYVISMPNMYARGILFGKMVIELGDTCTAKCEKLGMTADIEFKTKVTFTHSEDRRGLTFFCTGFLFWGI